jgi:hypothetical protein
MRRPKPGWHPNHEDFLSAADVQGPWWEKSCIPCEVQPDTSTQFASMLPTLSWSENTFRDGVVSDGD